MVQDWHRKFGVLNRNVPELADEQTDRLRIGLIAEELQEFVNALGFKWMSYETIQAWIQRSIPERHEGDLVKLADAIGDLLYVVYGAAVTYGIDMEPIFVEIHRSNISKGEPEIVRAPNGKILKGKQWTPPNLISILDRQMKRSER